jgi:hypothetical protein
MAAKYEDFSFHNTPFVLDADEERAASAVRLHHGWRPTSEIDADIMGELPDGTTRVPS